MRRWVLAGVLGLTLLLGVPPGAGASPPVTADPGAAVADSDVSALASAGTTTYLAGNFSRVGLPTGSALIFDAGTSGRIAFPQFVGGDVAAAVPDGSGGWYVGGTFDRVNGSVRIGLAHVRANGSVDPSFPQLSAHPYGYAHESPFAQSLALSADGKTLYVGGYFDGVGGQARASLAAIDTASDAVTTWNPNLSSGSNVRAIAVGVGSSAGYVFVGGSFTSVGGASVPNLAKIAASSGLPDTSFDPSPEENGSTLQAEVKALALNSTGASLYIGGYFDTLGGAPRNFLARVSTTGGSEGQADAWNPAPDDEVNSISLTAFGLTVFIGGDFSSVDGLTRNAVAAVSPATGTPTSWQASIAPGEAVTSVAVSSAGLLVTGSFSRIGTSPRPGLAALDVGSGQLTSFDPAVGGFMSVAKAAGSEVFVGGQNLLASSISRGGLAAVDASGHVTAFAPQLDGGVTAMATSPDQQTLYAAGYFTTVNGQPRAGFAAFNTATGALTPWHSAFSSSNPHALSVSSLLVSKDGKTLYVGGIFDHLGTDNQPRSNLGAVSTADGKATSWVGGVSGSGFAEVNDLASSADGSTLYVAGAFTSAGANSAPRLNLASLSTAAPGNATSWAPNPQTAGSGSVSSVAVRSNGNVYIAGSFTTAGANTLARNDLAEIGPNGLAGSWAPAIAANDPLNNPHATKVALSPDQRTVFVAGRFDHISGAPRALLAELSASTGLATAWAPDLAEYYDGINDLLVTGGVLRIAGGFERIGNVDAQTYAQFTYLPTATTSPRLSGHAIYHRKLRCLGWRFTSAPPVSYALRWLRDGHPIARATKAVYVVQAADSGHAVTCSVTATNLRGSVSAQSRPVFPGPFIVSFATRHVRAGYRFSFRVTERARISIAIARVAGRRRTLAGVLRLSARAGSNTLSFTGRLGGRQLGKGRYLAVISARDALRHRSNVRRLVFTIA